MLYYFICLVKHGAKVHPTQLVTSDEGMHSGQLDFQHFMQLSGLRPDFRVRVEVYSLVGFRMFRIQIYYLNMACFFHMIPPPHDQK